MNKTRSVIGRPGLVFALALACVGCGPDGSSDTGREDGSVPLDTAVSDNGVADTAVDASQADASQLDASPADASNDVALDMARPDAFLPDGCLGGHVTYVVDGQGAFRTRLADPFETENLNEAFAALSPGPARLDGWVHISPDGEWILVETERFDPDCDGWACLALLPADLSSVETIRSRSGVVHPERYSAVAPGGTCVVAVLGHPDRDGIGLYMSERLDSQWSEPILITEASPFPYNTQPTFSSDGERLLFDCGEPVYAGATTRICEVGVDGSGFRVVWTPEQGGRGVEGRADAQLHHPAYAPDGSIVFEADWTGEQLWRLRGDGPPARVTEEFGNDNSPCVLPNGCIISLWLERPGGEGQHEIKVMNGSGGDVAMIRTGVDIVDIGLACSR